MNATTTVKTYRAASLAEALASVKSELGPEAVILSARQIRAPSFWGKGRACLEVEAAPPAYGKPVTEKLDPAAKAGGKGSMDELDGLRETVAKIREDIRRSHFESLRGLDTSEQLTAQLREDVNSVSSALRAVLAEAALAKTTGLPEAQVAVLKQLSENGVEPGNAESIIRSCEHANGDVSTTRRAVARFLMESIRTALPLCSVTQQTVAAFVGTTGVGKTTTIAKIAASCLNAGQQVGFISTDTYRIGALDQLRCYAQIMDVPMESVDGPDTMREAIHRLSGCKVILIDTAGKSPRNPSAISELAGLLSRDWVSEIHLVLAAGIGFSELRQVVEGFGKLRIDRLCWTKLDEAISFGALFNAQLLAQAPLSYLCAGQKVPEDLEAATPERITRLLLTANRTKR